MAGFDAGSAVEPMDWDFSKFGAGKGTVPEPSDVEIDRFMRQYQVLATQVIRSAEAQTNQQLQELIERRAKEDDPDSPEKPLTLEQSVEVMKQVDLGNSAEIANAMLDLIITITKGQPSREQLMALPHRVRGAFYGWLIGQLTNPDFSVAAGTRPSLSLVSGV